MHSLRWSVRSSLCAAFSAVVALGGGGGIEEADAQTFSNPASIRIPVSSSGPGPGSVYPSTIVVSGLTRPVGDVAIEIVGLTHTFPADVGLLLVAPSGRTVLLMADAGANCDVSNITLKFVDGAPPMTQECITPGTYSPTSFGTPTFPAPAPGAPNGSSLSQLSGDDGNGTWSLYVIDDAFLDSGMLAGGWSITFTPSFVTYQGRLERNDVVVNGPTDMFFSLFSSATNGSALATVQIDNVPVSAGLFTTEIPLNSSLFDATPRWLEIAVRNPPGSGFFRQLLPRQPLDSAPLALHARTAGFATAAGSAERATHAQTASIASLATHADDADIADVAVAATRLDAPDGSPTGVVVISNGGDVGIPIATVGNKFSVFGNTHLTGDVALGPNLLSAQTLLHVSSGTSGAAVQPDAQLLVEGFGPCYVNLATQNANEHGVTFGSPAGSVHGGIYYKNSVGMDFRTGNDASRMTINALGNVGIGVGVSGGSIDARLHVAGGAASTRPLKVDRTGSDGELIAFARDDSLVGNITLAGGVVSYNAFTGSHWAWLEAPLERGMLVSMTGDNRRTAASADAGEIIYGARLTQVANDPACLGAYLADAQTILDDASQACHQIMAVGNGEMWVVNTGRDIRPGDYLISSDVPGCAMLDDPARFAVGNVVARAAERVDWTSVPPPPTADGVQRHRLSVLFGSFARTGGSDPATAESLRSRLKSLEAQNAELLSRLESIEKQIGRTPPGPRAR